MTYYPRFSISADPMPSARPEWIGLQLTTGLWVSATFSCSGVGQGFCYGHPGGIRLIVILAQRETAELVSQGHLRWPPSVGQDWGAIRKTDPRKTKSLWCYQFYTFCRCPGIMSGFSVQRKCQQSFFVFGFNEGEFDGLAKSKLA